MNWCIDLCVSLIDNTKPGDEPNEVYITKLALSLGRSMLIKPNENHHDLTSFVAIIRPKVENSISIQDRHPTSEYL